MQVMILLLKCSPNLEVLKLCYDEDGEWSENWAMMYELRHRNRQTRAAALRGARGVSVRSPPEKIPRQIQDT